MAGTTATPVTDRYAGEGTLVRPGGPTVLSVGGRCSHSGPDAPEHTGRAAAQRSAAREAGLSSIPTTIVGVGRSTCALASSDLWMSVSAMATIP